MAIVIQRDQQSDSSIVSFHVYNIPQINFYAKGVNSTQCEIDPTNGLLNEHGQEHLRHACVNQFSSDNR